MGTPRRRIGLFVLLVPGAVVAATIAPVLGRVRTAHAAFPGRNGKIAFDRAPPHVDPEGEDIAVMNADGTGIKQLTHLGGFTCCPDWSPDGKKIAFSSTPGPVPGSNIFVMNADGTGQTALTHNAHTGDVPSDGDPSWSPDGRRIAFSSYDPAAGHSEILVMNADGSGRTKLTESAADDYGPAWSPDGTRIAFERLVITSAGQPDDQIYVMNADGSGQMSLSNGVAPGNSPAWSPDGKRLAFVKTTGNHSQLYVMNADGSGQRQLTRSALNDGGPVWSPDGKKIVFARGSPTITAELFVINADGSGLRQLTHDHNAHNDYLPDWQRLPLASGGTATPPQASATGTVLVNGQSFASGPIPYGATVDVTGGRLTLTADVGTLLVYGDGTDPAIFRPSRASGVVRSKRVPFVQLTLAGGDFSVCRSRRLAGVDKKKRKVVRALWGHGKGHFRTKGRYSTVSVRGTTWLTADRCDGTFTLVKQGTVTIRDSTRGKTVQIRAGHSYLAPAHR